MGQRLGVVFGLLLLATGLAAQDFRQPREYEFNVEGGLDFRSAYREISDDFDPFILADGAKQAAVAPYLGLSAMRRIPGLRAFYGLRLDGSTATIDHPNRVFRAGTRAATAMLTYRAFVFDMQGDCDCPTWGNDPWFKKAFFVELGLGAGYQTFIPTGSNQQRFNTVGGAYLARLGVSHRLSKRFDIYAAGGLHGIIADREAFRLNDFGLRPTLGLTYRPGK